MKEALGHLVMLEEKGVVKSSIEEKPWHYLPV
jgi:predicted transcriptional regulator